MIVVPVAVVGGARSLSVSGGPNGRSKTMISTRVENEPPTSRLTLTIRLTAVAERVMVEFKHRGELL